MTQTCGLRIKSRKENFPSPRPSAAPITKKAAENFIRMASPPKSPARIAHIQDGFLIQRKNAHQKEMMLITMKGSGWNERLAVTA